MKYAVCSLAIGEEYREKVFYCIQTQEEHAKKHGYTRITDESVYDPERPHSWSKIRLIQKYLGDYDYLMWIDADVLITNFDRKIEDFIELMNPDTFLLMCEDLNGLNAGVFIIKNIPRAHEFLKDVWSTNNDSPYWEQASIVHHLPKYQDGVQIIPREYSVIMNAYGPFIDKEHYWQPGDFCIHFAGIHDLEPLIVLQDAYLRAQSHHPDGEKRIEEYTKSTTQVESTP